MNTHAKSSLDEVSRVLEKTNTYLLSKVVAGNKQRWVAVMTFNY